MTDLKTIGAIVGIGLGAVSLLVTGGNILINETKMWERVVALDKIVDAPTLTNIKDRLIATEEANKNFRDEMKTVFTRENGLADGIRDARNEAANSRTEILGKLDGINIVLKGVERTLDEVRDVQHKHPSSLNGNGTSQ